MAKRFHARSIAEVIGFNKDIVHCCKDLDEDLLVVPLDSKNTIDVNFLHDWNIKDRDHHFDSKKELGFIKADFTGWIFSEHFTEVRFASFLSSGFTTMAVINPMEKRLAKRISVDCI